MSKTVSKTVKAYACETAGGEFKPFEYELGELGPEQVDVKVEYCGVCHSDLSMANNDWQLTTYPFVPGHEIVGTVEEVGSQVSGLQVGTKVGIGWFSGACNSCSQCLQGSYNLCASAEGIIVGRHGGFADRVRANQIWCRPLPEALSAAESGPLFCGGITVFNPLVINDLKPTSKVGVIGIGGLGHLALQFLKAWGCEVTAFSSNPAKTEEAKNFGAHHVVNSRDDSVLESLAGRFDFILSTVNVTLNWNGIINTLAPNGTLHIVGAVEEPISFAAFPLIGGQRRIVGSPLGTPAILESMLEFCARHQIVPQTEHFKLSQVNDAMEHLKAGKARYRIVLDV